MRKEEVSSSAAAYLYLAGSILFTVYGQIVIKWQVGRTGGIPSGAGEDKARFIASFLLNPWVLTSLFSAFLAFLCWVGALAKLPLSYAYPFTSITFVLLMILSSQFFNEPVTVNKLLGVGLIIAGLIIGSRQ